MESNQLNNIPNEDALFELLTLTCEIDGYETKYYRNKEGQYHRIHGPTVIFACGEEWWFKNGEIHREDGPAMVNCLINIERYFISGGELSKKDFIQWQKDNGIKPIK